MNSQHLGLRPLVALLALLPAAHAVAALAATPTPSPLEGTAWVLERLGQRQPQNGTTITLRFEAGRVAGSDGCNRFGAPVTVRGTGPKSSRSGRRGGR
jgi:heat shock protein HslJ